MPTRYGLSAGSRSASMTAALVVGGTIITGLYFAAPKFVPGIIDDGPIKLQRYDDPLPPPPDIEPEPVKQKIVEQTTAPDPKPFVIDPIVPTRSESTITGTDQIEIPPLGPTVDLPPGPGPIGSGEKPTPAPKPPLIAPQADPRYASQMQPPYPPAERRRENEGSVVVRVLVGTDGRVTQVEKVRAASDAFYEVTRRQALSRWRFKPATRGGVADPAWMTMTVHFEMTR